MGSVGSHTAIIILIFTVFVNSLSINTLRSFICSSNSTQNVPQYFCHSTCHQCSKRDWNIGTTKGWCPSGAITIYPSSVITSAPQVENFNPPTPATGEFCWDATIFSLNNLAATFTYESVSIKMTVSCSQPPQWGQCDVPGIVLFVAVGVVILLLLICMCTCFICCCFYGLCDKEEEDSLSLSKKLNKTLPKKEESKPTHPMFSQDVDLSKYVSTKPQSKDDNEISLEEISTDKTSQSSMQSLPTPPVPIPPPSYAPMESPDDSPVASEEESMNPTLPPPPAPINTTAPVKARSSQIFNDDGILDMDALDSFFS